MGMRQLVGGCSEPGRQGWLGLQAQAQPAEGASGFVFSSCSEPPGGHPKGLTCCLFHTHRPARMHSWSAFVLVPRGLLIPGSCFLIPQALGSSLTPCVPSSHRHWSPLSHKLLTKKVSLLLSHLKQMFDPYLVRESCALCSPPSALHFGARKEAATIAITRRTLCTLICLGS